MKDSYDLFFSKFKISKEEFVEFGINEIIHPTKEKAAEEWASLKLRIKNNDEVFIRGFGRNSKSSHHFTDFYRHVVNNDKIAIDMTNNAKPTKMLLKLTGISKKKDVINYQVSHVFGRTKNIYSFTAPWNVVYIPKIMDPFTGHEASGELVKLFTDSFQGHIYKVFEPLIEDFNQIMLNSEFQNNIRIYTDKLKSSISQDEFNKLDKSLKTEFLPITINNN